ncbi:phosphoribosylanthranilate isomerase [Blattabacterium cuenoti]|uniref:phosphoribosylanthranilate isomerase n=1 Tax=Blattabacterium cuenoti TaxID=1653831 RepID=UPI00163B9CE5|nr:phosphoribosylanthranilate isomerase [Blattabacterium cuenoti]
MLFKTLKIKICGIKYNYQEIYNLFPDFIGFIFYSNSPRFVGENFDYQKSNTKIFKVGVFVNESENNIIKINNSKKLDFVQLHGKENVSYCERLFQKGLKIIKSFRIKNSFSFKKIKDFTHFCNYFLFDSYTTHHYGGSGKKFNWEKLDEYNFKTPFFLSGGIGIEDLNAIKKFSHPRIFGIDINSKFEIYPGNKNIKLLKDFIKKIRKL